MHGPPRVVISSSKATRYSFGAALAKSLEGRLNCQTIQELQVSMQDDFGGGCVRIFASRFS